ncbi:MAG: ADP-glyceromanno-heptose 6-epimerase [Deltaproteobacteria bacterium]|nr:ADP-glyceromanno-heptose 6-epimerase [Deltaproteobacteria bacterium]
MIIVTGGAGFIGSAFVWKLNMEGRNDIIIVDELGKSDKWKNLVNRNYSDYVHKSVLLHMICEDKVPYPVDAVIHMGACSSTTERDADYLMENNYRYSRILAEWAMKRDIRFIYASSAATYGDGNLGFSDSDENSLSLRPINMYGYSKQLFDLWILRNGLDGKMAGIKFFNVFGPNEYHKGEMRSVVHKSFGEIRARGKVGLFRSYKSEYGDGEQKRDFIYIKDCVEVLWWLLNNRRATGIFNLGTGKARTWNDLVRAVFKAMDLEPDIEYIEMPESIRNQYQYFTEAQMEKLTSRGYDEDFHALEDAIDDYVVNYLKEGERPL